ncbi:cation:proton antiporter [Actinosynnema sp. NPDC047251]|uniref:Putative monovalent cation/proton antiporter n=1 Tax=Saccharothrix espanaensis (strain ATCC 51144 / DSM 44229 / JCM 9112 / NBRC 15066 / NRRL 15764) TaxID=1179773 RepID=K0JVW9_SACES|nr:cation:proton antiporter [Saccharothrix espanaensis]CCH29582.1 putative monovalent cation/proton antiporter [Saccharothrix espanaensis DSM 44229]
MLEFVAVVVLALVVIAAAAVVAPRLGVAAPLVLVLVGIAVAVAPVLEGVEVDPEWVLQGLLPPLLYSSAVSMPAMSFRREFRAISGLSVLLVVASALVLGALFAWLVPGLGFVWGVALGAIISPTDAVATSIIKGTGLPRRALVLLDGESLLNDATALVLLRTAVVATAAAFSFWDAVGTFAYAIAVAVAIGFVVGRVNLAVRRRVADATVNTILSFTVPFAAAVPAELLDSSGLVAAVVAGLVTGSRAPRVLPPRHRMSDAQNWATVELVLEGAVFLGMGLQLSAVLGEVQREHTGIGPAIGIAACALAVTLLVRAAYVAPLLWALRRRAAQWRARQPRLAAVGERIESGDLVGKRRRGIRRRELTERDLQRFATRVRRSLADIDYLLKQPLGAREGVVVVWAGMRGAVTVAAAQTLPADTPHRPLLVFVAFSVATLSLLVQGGTVGPLVQRLFPAEVDERDAREQADEREQILALVRAAAADTPRPEGLSDKEHLLAVLDAQREALLDARDDGTFDADALSSALRAVDAEQITIELRGGPTG